MPRPIGVNLKPEQRQQITELYLSGVSSAEIARMLGVAKSTVHRHTLREGLREKVVKAGKRLSPETITEIKEKYQTTLISKERLAKMFEVSYDTIDYHTKGLSREIPPETMDRIVNLYLEGVITAEQVYEKIGLGKQDLYKSVKEAVVDEK